MKALRCIAGRHRRDGDTIRRIDGRWLARCRRCGSALVRTAPKAWQALGQVGPVARESEKAAQPIEAIEAVALRMALAVQAEEIRRFGRSGFADRDYFLDLYRRCLRAARGDEPEPDAELLLLNRVGPSAEPPLLLTRSIAAH